MRRLLMLVMVLFSAQTVWAQRVTPSDVAGIAKALLSKCADGQVLVKDVSVSAGVRCATPGSGGGTPASPTGSVQFNNAGSFGGSADLTWNTASNAALDLVTTRRFPVKVTSVTAGSIGWGLTADVQGAANLNGIEIDQTLTGVGAFGTTATGYFALFTINAGVAADRVVAFDAEGFNSIGAGATLTEYVAFRSESTSGATGDNYGLQIDNLGSNGVNTSMIRLGTPGGSGVKKFIDTGGWFDVLSDGSIVSDPLIGVGTRHVCAESTGKIVVCP